MGEAVTLPRRVAPQPIPPLYAGGDCGACVLAGLLGISVSDAYGFRRDREVSAFSWSEMNGALWRAQAHGLIDRLIDDVPRWMVPDAVRTYGDLATQQSIGWFRYITMALDGGCYGICAVDSEHRGPHHVMIDHWVMIVGARRVEVPIEHGARIDQELLLSNSSTKCPSEEWVGVHEFLGSWGGFNVLLARPAR